MTSMLRDSRRLHFKTKDQERYCEEIFELMTEPSSDDLTVRRMNQYLFHSVLESMGFVITEAQVKEYVFELDYGYSETVGWSEFQRIFLYLDHLQMTPENQFDIAFRKIDTLNRGYITRTQLVKVALECRLDLDQDLIREMFHAFDSDRSHRITKDELMTGFDL